MVTVSDCSDYSRDSAKDIIENDAIIVTASNQPETSTNIMDKVQDTTLEAQTSLPSRIALQQTRSETIQNAGEIYRSDANWYCRHCKLSGIVGIASYLVTDSILKSMFVKGAYLCDHKSVRKMAFDTRRNTSISKRWK
jgi:hypothetical protein